MLIIYYYYIYKNIITNSEVAVRGLSVENCKLTPSQIERNSKIFYGTQKNKFKMTTKCTLVVVTFNIHGIHGHTKLDRYSILRYKSKLRLEKSYHFVIIFMIGVDNEYLLKMLNLPWDLYFIR